MDIPFAQVDVFSAEPYLGNPVAVVLDAARLSEEAMQRLAVWTNLSETTFILPPTDARADYRLRIFTPGGELPFAGHPTLGSAHAWLENGGVPHQPGRIIQQCNAGLIELRLGDQLAFSAPQTTRSGPVDEELVSQLAAGLRVACEKIIDHQWVVNGPNWLCLRLQSSDEVLGLKPDFTALAALKMDIGIIGFYPEGSSYAYEVRAFASENGRMIEDPVTGSLNASVAQWLHKLGAVPDSYYASQGTCVGRAGRVKIDADPDGAIWVGGATRTLIHGSIAF